MEANSTSASSVLEEERKMRPLLFVCGDLSNLGDLALLLQNIELANSDARPFHVRRWASLPAEIEDHVTSSGGRFLEAKRFWRSIVIAAKSDIVIGGGQLIRNNASLVAAVYLMLSCIICRVFGGTIFTRGLGVSRLSKPRNIIYSVILSLAKQVNVRDQASFDNVQALPVLGSKAVITADMLFFPTEFSGNLRADSNRDRNLILLSPCVDPGEGRSVAGPNLVHLIDNVKQALPASKVVIVCHDVRPGMDYDAAKNLIDEYGLTADIHNSPSLDELVELYRSASFVVTNRMHSLIIALLAGAPAVVIDDKATKINYIVDSFGIDKIEVASTLPENLANSINRAISFDRIARGTAIELMAQRSTRNLARVT